MAEKNKKRPAAGRLSAAQILVIGFAAVILIGGTLLMLPQASVSGRSCGPEAAYFTAVSCTCVTGLAVRDTATSWTVFGQIVMLVMIQTGGLGFMTMAVMISTLIRRAMSPQEKQVAAASLGFSSRADTIGMVRKIFLSAGLIEGAGALLLMIRFVPMFGAKGIWYGVFHSISA
ncbi:MAG: Trk family potassium uptake protein, partial [Clostridiales bacterium]|nr:Trk family potassium uptake protein [Clostridiales bacterium]